MTLSNTDPQTVTRLLNQAAAGESAAVEELLPLVYDQLRGLASGYFRDQAAGHTLQPTALVHEAYMKLVGPTDIQWESRRQFLALAHPGTAIDRKAGEVPPFLPNRRRGFSYRVDSALKTLDLLSTSSSFMIILLFFVINLFHGSESGRTSKLSSPPPNQ